ncbi:HAD family hydrolase [Lactonifactor longoviformis]|uniref:HAD family hydrolase n=1 Tax=Lactonifactor longoviformis TaxID=341220 RepID=UPI0036F3313D
MKNQLKGAIFDADGTLLDSMYLWDALGNAYLNSRGITPRADLNAVLETLSLPEAAEYFRAKYGVKESAEEIIRGINRIIFCGYRDTVPLKPGVVKVLNSFSHMGIPMCVATSTDRPLIEAAFARNGILKYFQKIITCTEAGTSKRESKIYFLAADTLGTSPEDTWVFEDAYFAAQTAKNAGFHLAGILDPSEKNQEKLAEISDIYLHSWDEWEE